MKLNEANIRHPEKWKSDSWESVEFYNNWFMTFAPTAFQMARKDVLKNVILAFKQTNELTELSVESILATPQIISVLRMATAPPLAQDRLAGLSYVNKSILKTLEQGNLPKSSDKNTISISISKMLNIIKQMLDKELFPWLSNSDFSKQQRNRSAAIVADRLTGMLSDPLIRNAQEKRQLNSIGNYLDSKGYILIPKINNFLEMPPKSYSYHVNIIVNVGQIKTVNMPIDVIIQPPNNSSYPLLVECKSAGDFTNTNKRRKEEAVKITQLKATYGNDINLCLFLCGYFDTGYLGYEAAEGIDWVWEHRISDFEKLGI